MDSKQAARRCAVGWILVSVLLAVFGLDAVAQNNLPSQMKEAGGPPSPSVAAVTGLSKPNLAAQGRILQGYGKLPLSFEANEGQTDGRVKFLSRGSGYTLFLTPTDAVLALRETISPKNKATRAAPAVPSKLAGSARRSRTAALRMRLVGANPKARIVGEQELSSKSNYFIGNDPNKWRTNVPTYAKVKYEGVYPGVDLVYYGNQGQLEYDFVVAPGADPHDIGLHFAGARRIRIEKETGDLLLRKGKDFVRFKKPLVYQMATDNGPRTTDRALVEGRYKLTGRNQVAFEVGSYDRTKPLVIDPALTYSTYLGGSGGDDGYGITVDASGNAYVVGETGSSDFPITPLAFQKAYGGLDDAFVTKLNSAGSALVYSTYVGGSNTDGGFGIAVDASGNAYVTGRTYSSDFPTTPGAFQTACGGCNGSSANAFVTKLNPSGSALAYSTYLGGSNPANGSIGYGIALDTSGDAYVTGQTSSSDFPTTPGAFQTTCGGSSCGNAFVTEFTPPGSALVYSTYLGVGDSGQSIAVDVSGDAYVTGRTYSLDFPTTPGAFQTTCGGGSSNCYYGDAFIAEVNPTGAALVYSTYLGGSSTDQGQGIALDASGDAYVTGFTDSTDFPITAGAFQTTCETCNPQYAAGDAFVAELNPTGSALVYSTYLGSSLSDSFGIAVDPSGNAYVTGYTDSANFPTTPDAFQATCGGGCTGNLSDAFVTELNPMGSALIYSTYLGGSSADQANGIAVDSSGNIYVTGITYSSDFPTTPGAFQTICGECTGNPSAFVSKFLVAVGVSSSTLTFGNQTLGTTSAPQNTFLINGSTSALSITSISVTGTNSGDFAEINTCGSSLAAGASCAVTVTFTPSITGTESATVSITDNAANSPQTVALSGTGVLPVATLSPASLNFGNQPLGVTSPPQTVTLSTNGPITITSITTTAQFAQTNNCGSSLPAGGTCTINVTFTPTAFGVQTGTLTVSDNGAGSPQTVSLSGTGSTLTAMLSPTSLTFPTQVVFTTSKAQTATLTNTGTGTLTITNIAATGQFSQTNTCGTSVAPGASCTISVTFKPTSKGPLTGSVSVTDNAPGSPQKVTLTGTGTYIQLSPVSLNFGSQPVHTKSLPKKITLTNKGSVAVSVTGISITGADPGDFSQTNGCGSSVAAGASCFITTTFTPLAKGKRTATVSVSDNGGGSPQKVSLTGTGT